MYESPRAVKPCNLPTFPKLNKTNRKTAIKEYGKPRKEFPSWNHEWIFHGTIESNSKRSVFTAGRKRFAP